MPSLLEQNAPLAGDEAVEAVLELVAGEASIRLVTEDGDVYSGLMVEKTAERVTLRDAQNRLHTVASADIQQLQQQPQSLMPEQLLRDMTRQEAADLLEFLARQQAATASP